MSILVDENTTVMVQGITGKEGARTTKDMLDYGTKVVCGVTPGKGGQEVEGVPVYNTVKEAVHQHHPDVSVIYVPPSAAKNAAIEAIENGIRLVNVITETVPIHDTAQMLAYAKRHGATIVGPSSAGILCPGKTRIGSVGGEGFTPGKIGIISKSGAMSKETATLFTHAGFGQSTVVTIGGDVLIGSTFADILRLFGQDKDTDAIVLFGEIGGTYEEDAAAFIKQGGFTKPVAAFISGTFASSLPNVSLGHAGAIIEGGKGTRESKIKALKDAGVMIAEVHHELVDLIKGALKK